MTIVLLVPPLEPGDDRPALILFPYAGSGALAYRGWAAELSDLAGVTTVLLPGREQLFGEPLLRSMPEVLHRLMPLITEVGPRPVVLFGHSMGAAIAFGLARELRRRAAPAAALIVSGAGSPCRRDRHKLAHRLDDGAFAQHVIDYGGMPPELLADPDATALFLPILRADFQLLETWAVERQPPLDIPVTVLRGTDDATVTDHQIDGWAEHVAGPPVVHTVVGGHFFLHTARAEVMTTIRRTLTLVSRGRGSRHPADRGHGHSR
ncbi:thioesterase II family protein [Solwaraspora sp. WMMB335]|uniref:thioesterase II family protein n=1 Tax=Solwaraspora sp. WMMB335 TaxID=3404118 RepID=UPI003B92E6C9